MQWYTKTTYHPGLAEDFLKAINGLKGKKVAIFTHRKPDGDAIGSQVALCRVLKLREIDAVCVYDDPVPQMFKSFIGDTPFIDVRTINIKDYMLVSVDCGNYGRIGGISIEDTVSVYMNIDHHISNNGYAQYNFVVSEVAATAEVLAELFFSFEMPIDTISAQALYLGIATDTGQFRYGSTKARVFEIAQRLTELGASPSQMSQYVYENKRFASLQLLHLFLGTLKLEANGQVCVGLVKREFFAQTATTTEDTEHFVDYARSVEGVQIALYLEEKEDSIKGSLRAKTDMYELDKFAQNFNGGGHAAAAGFRIFGSQLNEVYSLLIKKLEEHINNYK